MLELKADILKYIREHDTATFAELGRNVPGFKGTLKMHVNGLENVIFWHKISNDAIDALDELLKEKLCFMVPTTDLVYKLDFGLPDFPVATEAKSYKRLHWMPVVFTHKEPK